MQKIVLVKRCLGNNAVICKFFLSEASLYINIYWDRYCIFGAGNWLFELGGGYRLSVAACSLSLALVYFLFVLFKLSTDLLKDLVKPPLFSFHLEKKEKMNSIFVTFTINLLLPPSRAVSQWKKIIWIVGSQKLCSAFCFTLIIVWRPIPPLHCDLQSSARLMALLISQCRSWWRHLFS